MKVNLQVTNSYDSESIRDSWSLAECVDVFFFHQEILRLHSTPQMGHAVTAVKDTSASSIEQVYAVSTIIVIRRYYFVC